MRVLRGLVAAATLAVAFLALSAGTSGADRDAVDRPGNEGKPIRVTSTEGITLKRVPPDRLEKAQGEKPPVGTLSVHTAQHVEVDGPFYILNHHNNRCLEGEGDHHGNGTRVQLWDCDFLHHILYGEDRVFPNQYWWLEISQDGRIRFRNYHSDLYMEADPGALGGNGAGVRLWQYAEAPYQWWAMEINPEGYLQILNTANWRYLDADITTVGDNGSRVVLWDHEVGGTNQWWK